MKQKSSLKQPKFGKRIQPKRKRCPKRTITLKQRRELNRQRQRELYHAQKEFATNPNKEAKAQAIKQRKRYHAQKELETNANEDAKAQTIKQKKKE